MRIRAITELNGSSPPTAGLAAMQALAKEAVESGTVKITKVAEGVRGKATPKNNTAKPAVEKSAAQPKPAEPVKGKADFLKSEEGKALVREGKEILAQEDKGYWRLGEIASGLETEYGQKTLEHYAKAIGVAACTLERHRNVYRAWHSDWHSTSKDRKSAPGPELPKSYSVARELQDADDRFDLIEANPNMSKREARDLRLMRAGKGPKQKVEKGTTAWLRNNSDRWFKHVYELATKIIREVNIAATAKTTEPELKEIYREVIAPELLPTIRSAGDGLIQLADYLETVLREDEDAEPEEDDEQAQAEAA
jgi:hypothetical protein